MAQFYAEIQGSRGLASRMGSKKSGIWAHIRGWNNGVSINGIHDHEEDEDIFEISVTSGSGYGSSDKYIGKVVLDRHGPTFVPAD